MLAGQDDGQVPPRMSSETAPQPLESPLLAGGASEQPFRDAQQSNSPMDFEDEDELADDSANPIMTWVTLLGRALISLLSAVFWMAGFALYPLYCLIPSYILDLLFRGVFRLGYLVYLTPLGETLHLRSLRPNQPPHSAPVAAAQLTSCLIHTVPIMDNNYAYLLIDKATKTAAVVDPADPYAVLHAVEVAGCTLTHILTTHHHHDHAGGNHELCKRVRELHGRKLVVVGGKKDRVPACTLGLNDGERCKVGETEILVVETPCHTRGHVLFCVLGGRAGAVGGPAAGAADAEAVFSGDTVFIGGVGAFFHGSAKDMDANLNTRMASLPDSALLFCGHEYTVDNLRFAAWLEPDNLEVLSRFLVATAKRNTGEPTVPSTLGWERRTNPYFRSRDERMKRSVAARAAWLERRRRRNFGERVYNAVTGAGKPPGPTNRKLKMDEEDGTSRGSLKEDLTPIAVYEKLQQLLSSALWQNFKINTGSAAAVRRRAAQIASAGRSAPGMSGALLDHQSSQGGSASGHPGVAAEVAPGVVLVKDMPAQLGAL